MSQIDRGTCKGCGAAILWAEMAGGRRAPFDARAGTILLEDKSGTQGARYVRGHVSHFSTCPMADQFRKTKETQS
ncbi:MAG: hypothetical protein ACRD1X_12500 [Vicinamibacteria bacterium]